MKDKKIKIVLVGHVDHGKSTVLGRLLIDSDSLPEDRIREIEKIANQTGNSINYAFLLDHLDEEREHGITIDTTQAYIKKNNKEYVLIDAPGHTEFIKNMITGTAQADAAILVLDAEEGICEQTKRHSFILSMLGITQIILIVNKMDKVNYREETYSLINNEIKTYLEKLNIKLMVSIPISAVNGENIVLRSDNMPFYKGPTLWEAFDILESKNYINSKTTIMPIQDMYQISDKKLYVGRIESGKLSAGNIMKLLPENIDITIKAVEKYGENCSEYESGDCIGFTINENYDMLRGDILSSSDKELSKSKSFRATILWTSNNELRPKEKILIKCLTQEVQGFISKIHRKMDSSDLTIIDNDLVTINELQVCDVDICTDTYIVVSDISEYNMLGKIVVVMDKDICGNGIVTACYSEGCDEEN